MKSFQTILLIALLAGADPFRTDAHAFISRSEPQAGQELPSAPEELRIWFTEQVKPSLSTIQVFDAKGKQMDKQDLRGDQADDTLVRLSLSKLAPGTYKVVWNAVAGDLHTTKGDFLFRVGASSSSNPASK